MMWHGYSEVPIASTAAIAERLSRPGPRHGRAHDSCLCRCCGSATAVIVAVADPPITAAVTAGPATVVAMDLAYIHGCRGSSLYAAYTAAMDPAHAQYLEIIASLITVCVHMVVSANEVLMHHACTRNVSPCNTFTN